MLAGNQFSAIKKKNCAFELYVFWVFWFNCSSSIFRVLIFWFMQPLFVWVSALATSSTLLL